MWAHTPLSTGRVGGTNWTNRGVPHTIKHAGNIKFGAGKFMKGTCRKILDTLKERKGGKGKKLLIPKRKRRSVTKGGKNMKVF